MKSDGIAAFDAKTGFTLETAVGTAEYAEHADMEEILKVEPITRPAPELHLRGTLSARSLKAQAKLAGS